eukprot:COSAG06_NODE_4000_length_4674_cov_6.128087_3_plen_630_part_00
MPRTDVGAEAPQHDELGAPLIAGGADQEAPAPAAPILLDRNGNRQHVVQWARQQRDAALFAAKVEEEELDGELLLAYASGGPEALRVDLKISLGAAHKLHRAIKESKDELDRSEGCCSSCCGARGKAWRLLSLGSVKHVAEAFVILLAAVAFHEIVELFPMVADQKAEINLVNEQMISVREEAANLQTALADAQRAADRAEEAADILQDKLGVMEKIDDMFGDAATAGLTIPTIARPLPPCGPHLAGKLSYDSTGNSTGKLMQCGASGIWSSASNTMFDSTDVVDFARRTQEISDYLTQLSTGRKADKLGYITGSATSAYQGQYNLGISRGVSTEDLLEASDRNGRCPGGKYSSGGTVTCSSTQLHDPKLAGHGCQCKPAVFRIAAGMSMVIAGTDPARRFTWAVNSSWTASSEHGFKEDWVPNQDIQGYRSGLFNLEGGDLSLAHLSFSGAGCTQQSCGSVVRPGSYEGRRTAWSRGAGSLDITNCEFAHFVGTWSYDQGGVINFSGYIMSVADSTFTNNRGQKGGAIYISGSQRQHIMITNTAFGNNTAQVPEANGLKVPEVNTSIYWSQPTSVDPSLDLWITRDGWEIIGSATCLGDTAPTSGDKCYVEGTVAYFGFAIDQDRVVV